MTSDEPCIVIEAPYGDGREFTYVRFPEYEGWRVFSADIACYTLSVVLTSREVDAPDVGA